jgi:heavy metal efflux system protein
VETLLAAWVQRRLLVCVAFSLVAVAGVVAFRSLPIDAFPDLTNNQVQVLTEVPGMAAAETEQRVTIPLESILNGLPRVQQVRSLSKFGLSVVTVVFQDGVNTYFARQLVNERLQGARARLPEGLTPTLGPITTGMGEIYQYTLEGPGYTPTELKTLHDWEIKPHLRSVPGVNEVNTWGGLTQEYQVLVSPERLQQTGLTLADVAHALRQNNQNFSGGILEHGAEQLIVRGVGRVDSLAAIENTLIKRQDLAPVSIKHVATVQFGAALRQGAVTKDGRGEVVTGMVMMLKGENSRGVIERVKAKLRAIKPSLPEGVRIRPFYDQTRLVDQTLHTVQTNLWEGGLLVVAVLLFMLGNLRAALIVAFTIPMAMMFSFIGMKALGVTANIMSLGAIDFGMMVDGSIVMVENILHRLTREHTPNTPLMPILQAAVKEMARPIFFGVLIITVVYAPILSLTGMEYKMFSPMVLTVSFALLGSLLISLVLVPVLCSLLLGSNPRETPNALIEALRRPVQGLLGLALRRRREAVGLALLGFLGAVALVPFLGTEFVPQLDEGDFIVETRNLPSSSLAHATAVTTQIEAALQGIPEVKTVVSKTGRPDLATDPMGVYQSDVYVILHPRGRWRRGVTKAVLADTIRTRLAQTVLGASFNLTQPIAMRVNELVSGVRADVAVKLFGDNLAVLTQKDAEIEAVMGTVPGVTDLQTEKLAGNSQLLITPDRSRLALYGLNVADVQEVVETAIMGKSVSEVLEGRRRFDLRLKFPQGSHLNPASVGHLLIESPSGERVPLSQVADVSVGEGLEVIHREFGQRRLIVQMNVRQRDIGSVVAEGMAKIRRQVTLPAGVTLDWGGQFENQQRAMARLMVVVPLSIGLILLLLMATFSSLPHALIVLLNVPFALIGGVLALWVRGLYLSVPAAIGFIALFGLAILNGLVLVSTINRARAQDGLTLQDAVRHGVNARLRPVLMTATVAALGFFPMAYSTGSGAEVQRPLATVVIGGLVSATLLTLFLLPVAYTWVEERKLSPRKEDEPSYVPQKVL